VLVLAGVALTGGCTSDADRINRTVFDAVRRDPLFRWRPEWVIRVSDSETPTGGPYPESAPRLTHDLYAQSLPSSAESDAFAVAMASGWTLRYEGYVKPIDGSNLKLWVTISESAQLQSVGMIFSGQYSLSGGFTR